MVTTKGNEKRVGTLSNNYALTLSGLNGLKMELDLALQQLWDATDLMTPEQREKFNEKTAERINAASTEEEKEILIRRLIRP